MEILLVISSLEAGGAERVMSILANEWVGEEWDVRILTFDDGSTPPFYPLGEGVEHKPLGIYKVSSSLREKIGNNVERLRTLRREIAKFGPDIVLSFMDRTNVLTAFAARSLGLPVVVSERVHPGYHEIGSAWEALRLPAYWLASAVVVQTERVRKYFSAPIRSNCVVIPNPVQVPTAGFESSDLREWGDCGNEFLILGMGRLERQKGFDLLLDAAADLESNGVKEDWSVVVLGEGTEREALLEQRAQRGLQDRVRFPGRVDNPGPWLQRADLFVLPSRYEGFPNALCEAMAHGCPVVAADCPSGPREIVRENIDGILVDSEDSSALADGIKALIENPSERIRMAERGTDILDRYGMERVRQQWEMLFEEVLEK